MSLTFLALASTSAASAATDGQGYTGSLISMVGGLLLVLAIIFVLAYLVRRLKLVPSAGGTIRTLAVTPLGQREKLVLAQVGEQQYLLGVTTAQITLIDKLETPLEIPETAFAARLQQAKAKQS